MKANLLLIQFIFVNIFNPYSLGTIIGSVLNSRASWTGLEKVKGTLKSRKESDWDRFSSPEFFDFSCEFRSWSASLSREFIICSFSSLVRAVTLPETLLSLSKSFFSLEICLGPASRNPKLEFSLWWESMTISLFLVDMFCGSRLSILIFSKWNLLQTYLSVEKADKRFKTSIFFN